MLVITRKVGEKVFIPELGVEIVVARVLPTGAVRIGIRAPASAKIIREELMEAKK